MISHTIRHALAVLLFIAPFAVFGQAHAVSAYETLLVPRVTIYPGDLISAEMLTSRRIRTRKIGRMPVIRETDDIIGKVSRRTLLPGRPILKIVVRNPALVTRGRSSIVVFRSGGLVITSYATALEAGAVGDLIKLRTVDGGRIVTGLVQNNGTVLVGAQ
ncbi:MAG: flagellar basal body P-ring formation chaperone FlgA [Hyphomicrobiaceae bacterium]